MSNSKKRLRKKINPEGSNKMIYAISIGLIIVFIVFYFLFTGKKEVKDKSAVMKNTLEYLKNTEGLYDIKFFPAENRVSFYYKSFSLKEKKKKPEYRRVAFYAGLKLSNRIPSEKITIELFNDKSKNAELELLFQNGRLINRVR